MTITTVRPVESGADTELDDILRTHRAQLFGHLARFAAHHNLGAADVAEILERNVDTVHDWQRWAAEGPACTCTRGHDGAIAVQHFDCPVHGDTVYRNQVRKRLVAG